MSQNVAPINWLNTIFLTVTPLAMLVLVPLHAALWGFTLYEWAWFGIYLWFTGMSITAGYHRLYSHKAYKAHWSLRLFFALFGAAACQNSILEWSSDHRVHHRFVDEEDKDPYAATKGFWFSHMGWIMRNYPKHTPDLSNVKDLARDPIVAWQHKYYLHLAVFMNGVVPILLGMAVGRPFGVFVLAFLLRVVLNHHFTFFINSLAHIWGRRPYSDLNSSRDNDLLALVTYGEGYHNYHHTFQHDYRNGVRWWHFDPGKWLIRSCAWLGLASNLKMTSKEKIEKARVQMQLKRALNRLETRGETAHFRESLEASSQKLIESLNNWATIRRQWYEAKRQAFAERWEQVELRNKYLEMKYDLMLQRRQWRLLLADLAAI